MRFQANTSGISVDVTSWVEFSTKGNHSLHYLYNSDRIYVLGFNRDQQPPFVAPGYILQKYQDQLIRVLDADNSRFGDVVDGGLILRLQCNLGARSGKLIVFPQDKVEHCLQTLSPSNPLTKAEKRTLLQIVCGYSLRDSAATDGISYETKRVQLKAILAKSRLKRQIDLSSFVMAQLLTCIESGPKTEVKFSQHAAFAGFARECLPFGMRTHTAIGEDGKHHRFLDMGPQQGKPVVVLHGQFLPCFTPALVGYLKDLNLRLIWPLRNGLLGPKDELLSFDEHVSHSVDSIELAGKLFCQKQSVNVIGVECAAHYCIAHAEKYEESASQYIFIGASSSQARKLITVGVSKGEEACFSNMNRMRSDYLISLSSQSLIDPSHLKKLLLGAYSSSSPDLKLIEEVFAKPQCSSALMYQFVNSANSIKHECSFHITPDWAFAKIIKQPVQIIHGSHDGINNLEDINAIGKKLGAEIVKVRNAGQLVLHSHFEDCMSIVVKSLVESRVTQEA